MASGELGRRECITITSSSEDQVTTLNWANNGDTRGKSLFRQDFLQPQQSQVIAVLKPGPSLQGWCTTMPLLQLLQRQPFCQSPKHCSRAQYNWCGPVARTYSQYHCGILGSLRLQMPMPVLRQHWCMSQTSICSSWQQCTRIRAWSSITTLPAMWVCD